MKAQLHAAKFKERCFSLLDHLDREGIILTKQGKPIARLVRIESDCAELIGGMKGRVRVKGDIFSTGTK